jgi:hypothetical protein
MANATMLDRQDVLVLATTDTLVEIIICVFRIISHIVVPWLEHVKQFFIMELYFERDGPP